MKELQFDGENILQATNYLVKSFASKSEVEGVLLLGGFSKDRVFDEYSDLDVCVFVNSGNQWLPKFEFSIQMQDDGKHFSNITLNVHQLAIETELASLWSDEKKYAFERGSLAYDKSGVVKSLIEKKTVFSQENINKLTYCATKIQLYLDINPTIQSKRGYHFLAHHIFNKGIDLLIDTVFLLNREHVPSDKWKLSLVNSLPWIPQNFIERLGDAMVVRKIDAASLKERVELFKPVLNEVCEEIEKFFSASILSIYEEACSGVLARQLNKRVFSDAFLENHCSSMSGEDKQIVEGFVNYHLIESVEQLREVILSSNYNKTVMGAKKCLDALSN